MTAAALYFDKFPNPKDMIRIRSGHMSGVIRRIGALTSGGDAPGMNAD